MFNFKHLLAAGALALCAAPIVSADDAVDGEGYPEMYVRGNFGGWGCDNSYRFSRTGNEYTITLGSLDGEFKIGGTDWKCNYGSNTGSTETISGSTTVTGQYDGPNFNAASLSDLTISFTFDPANPTAPTEITFTTSGVTPPTPDVEGLSGTLPVLYINVYTDAEHTSLNNEIIDRNLNHKNYFKNAEYWLDTNGCTWLEEEGATNLGSREEPLALEIKARGNWTRRGFSKKPFKLKLKEKQKMLGMSKSKHYAILAHADDSWGYLRNFTGFNLGKRIGLPWTPAQQPVEVVINGNYRGLYFLTESIRIEKDRINITELEDLSADTTTVSGGYLVELDNYDEDNQIRMEEKSCVDNQYLDMLRVTFDTPEEYSELQHHFITDQFTAMNDAVGANSDELWSYLDLDDAARYYLVEEIISHTESFHGSTYLFRDRGEGQKWHFSPLWDCGNAFSGPTDGFFYDHDSYGNTWIPSMRCNSAFNDKVRATWMWFMNTGYKGLEDDIRAYASHIAEAAKADRRRWKDEPAPDGGQGVADNSDMNWQRDRVLEHLSRKTDWLKNQFGDYTAVSNIAEPERDTTPAAPLPEYATTGVENIAAEAEAVAPEYYTLDGVRVATPARGGIYIERRGSAVRKIAL